MRALCELRVEIKRITRQLLILIVIIIMSGCSWFPEEEEVVAPPVVKPKPPQYNLYQVKKGSIIKSIKGVGSFIPSNEYTLFYKMDGCINKIYVNVGDTVSKGDILMELDTDDLEMTVKQQEYALEKVRLAISYLKDTLEKMRSKNMDTAEIEYQMGFVQRPGALGKGKFLPCLTYSSTVQCVSNIICMVDHIHHDCTTKGMLK